MAQRAHLAFMLPIGQRRVRPNVPSRPNLGWYVLLFALLAAILVALGFFLFAGSESNKLVSQTGPPGPSIVGPAGSCNLTQANQTFTVGGRLVAENGLNLTGPLIFDDTSAFLNWTDTCLQLEAPRVCVTAELFLSGQIGADEAGTLACVTFVVPVATPALKLGDVVFNATGSRVEVQGTVFFADPLDLPLIFDAVGQILEESGNLVLEGFVTIVFRGPTTFEDPVDGLLMLPDGIELEPGVSDLTVTGGNLRLRSTLRPILLQTTSPDPIVLDADVTDVLRDLLVQRNLNVFVNFTVVGHVAADLRFGRFFLRFEPNPTGIRIGTRSSDNCLEIASSTGVCLVGSVSNAGQTTFSGGPVIFSGTGVQFNGGAAVTTNLKVNQALSVLGDGAINGQFDVVGRTYLRDDVLVEGDLDVTGVLNATNLQLQTVLTKLLFVQTAATFDGVGPYTYGPSTVVNFQSSLVQFTGNNVSCSSPLFRANGPNPCVDPCFDLSTCDIRARSARFFNYLQVGTDTTTPPSGLITGLKVGLHNQTVASVETNAVTTVVQTTQNATHRAQFTHVLSRESTAVVSVHLVSQTLTPGGCQPLVLVPFTPNTCTDVERVYQWSNVTVRGPTTLQFSGVIQVNCGSGDLACFYQPGYDAWLDLEKLIAQTTFTLNGGFHLPIGPIVPLPIGFLGNFTQLGPGDISQLGTITFTLLEYAYKQTTGSGGQLKLAASTEVLVETPDTRVNNDLHVAGDILGVGAAKHDCCRSAPAGDPSTFLRRVRTADLAIGVSSFTAVPFTTLEAGTLGGYAGSTWTCPTTGMYAVTVGLLYNQASGIDGTFRGVALTRTFPTLTSATLLVCTHVVNNLLLGSNRFPVTCTYTSVFATGNTMVVETYEDAVTGPATIEGVGVDQFTRLEIMRLDA